MNLTLLLLCDNTMVGIPASRHSSNPQGRMTRRQRTGFAGINFKSDYSITLVGVRKKKDLYKLKLHGKQ